MKVALINAPVVAGGRFNREGRCTQFASRWATQWPPISLAYVAAVLLAQRHEPLVFDCPAAAMPAEKLMAALQSRPPELVLMPVSTPSFPSDMSMARAIKQALPAVKIAVFGVHATAVDREVLHGFAAVDFVIRREPEATAAELVGALENGGALSDVAGLTFRTGADARRNPDRPFIEDLDRLPFPAWQRLRRADYRLPFSGRPFLIVAPLRGCPHRCIFCTAGEYYGRQLRRRSVESIVREIRRDVEAFGVRDFLMWAETFTLDRGFVWDLAGALRRETPGVRWTCNSRLDTVDEELLRAMRAAGCWMIGFGVESTDAAVQARLRKNLHPADWRTPLRQARAAGIRTVGHFILGLPGDTPETMRQTIADAAAMDLDLAQFYAAAPFVGSELHREAAANGWLVDAAFSDMQQAAASLRLPGLPPAAVNAAIRRAYRRFYLRPRQLARVLLLAGVRGVARETYGALRAATARLGKGRRQA
jgi:radical SAM superfamily enzyme YgiQ (UPF0313 family)